MKKVIFLILFAVIRIVNVTAQDINIHKTDGSIINVPLSSIDSITFSEGTTPFVCGISTIIDSDGNVYSTVLIGGQCWMRENLNVGVRINSVVIQNPGNGYKEKYCYRDQDMNCDIFGGLYQWEELMQGSTTPGNQGLCPEGWHVPTKPDFEALVTFLGGPGIAGMKLKESGTAHWASPNTGTNESGFTAFGGGFWYEYNNLYGYLMTTGVFYTSTLRQNYNDEAWYLQMLNNSDEIEFGTSSQGNGLNNAYSVRCLKDQ